jgi:hypothetical protein
MKLSALQNLTNEEIIEHFRFDKSSVTQELIRRIAEGNTLTFDEISSLEIINEQLSKANELLKEENIALELQIEKSHTRGENTMIELEIKGLKDLQNSIDNLTGSVVQLTKYTQTLALITHQEPEDDSKLDAVGVVSETTSTIEKEEEVTKEESLPDLSQDEPVATKQQPKDKPKTKTSELEVVDIKTVQSALMNLQTVKGRDVTKGVMAEFKAVKISDIKPADYLAIIALADKTAASEEAA